MEETVREGRRVIIAFSTSVPLAVLCRLLTTQYFIFSWKRYEFGSLYRMAWDKYYSIMKDHFRVAA